MIDDPFGLTDEMNLGLLFGGRPLMESLDLLPYLQELRLCLDQQDLSDLPEPGRLQRLQQLYELVIQLCK